MIHDTMDTKVTFHFNREDAKIIKGVAIILMCVHHLWGFPDRVFTTGDGFDMSFIVFGECWYIYLAHFGKICVSIFFFLGGYGMMKSYQIEKLDLIGKLKGLYKTYWKVFCVFIPIAFIFFSDQPIYCANEDICSRYASLSEGELIQNFLGISSSYNSEWWFLRAYIVAMFTFPLVYHFLENHSVSMSLIGIIVWSILEMNVFPAIGNIQLIGTPANNLLYSELFCQSSPFITCFWMGILMAKENLLIKLAEQLYRNHLLNPIVDILFLLIIVYLRTSFSDAVLDFLYVPLMIIFTINLLDYIRSIRKLLFVLGKHSTNIWYIHTFICYYFYQFNTIIIWTRNPLISLVCLICLSYIASVFIVWFWKAVACMIHFVQNQYVVREK